MKLVAKEAEEGSGSKVYVFYDDTIIVSKTKSRFNQDSIYDR